MSRSVQQLNYFSLSCGYIFNFFTVILGNAISFFSAFVLVNTIFGIVFFFFKEKNNSMFSMLLALIRLLHKGMYLMSIRLLH